MCSSDLWPLFRLRRDRLRVAGGRGVRPRPGADAPHPPDTFDCSGLVRWAYLQIGVSLPHQTESLYAAAANRVPVSEARPGDVLYRPGHVGIAVGYGGVPYVHAPKPGAYVRDTDPLSWSGFTCALQF